MNDIIIGSRGSQLALWQSNWVKAELQRLTPSVNVVIETISTTGDKILDSPLAKIGDKGLFTKELEVALLNRSVDLAVHSLKDVPTRLPEGLVLAAITSREDVRDVFIAHPNKQVKRLDDVPEGGTIATGSLRRSCQLMSWRPDLKIVNIRGNLNTRFSKLDASDWDGMLLARAGVVRLGFEHRISEVISLERILPAVGQGALAIECRADNTELRKMLKPLESPATTAATLGERSLLRRLEGGCQVPIGTHGRIEHNVFYLDAVIGSLDGKKIVRGKVHGDPDTSEELGVKLAEILLKGGGKTILDGIRASEQQAAPAV
ncbi:MAG TPA: hydroxymethylbilane synthase [Bacteroidota bacterium]|nr:hydroxymethylbilane synthase [Bacteroidota bacterium]